jgi:phosphatidate cytidylyltransferase
MKIGNLALRFITVAPLVPLLILAIMWQRPEAWWGVTFFASAVGLYEFFSITHTDKVERWFGIVLGLGLAAMCYWLPWGIPVSMVVAVIVPALFYLFRFGELQTAISRAGITTFGIIYAGLLIVFVALQKLYLHQFNPHTGGADMIGQYFVLLTLGIGWFGDTGAYFAGRFLGKTKLYPAISPGKTRAGAIGGLAGSFLAAVICNVWLFKPLGWVHGAIITIVGGALGQCGDLVESMLKRAYGVKDSGKLLPGHGGILDRIDAVLFISPWVFFYASLVWTPAMPYTP